MLSSGFDSSAFVVVDAHGRIRYTSGGTHGEAELQHILVNRTKLQPEVAALIQSMPPFGPDDTGGAGRSYRLADNNLLRIVRLTGADGTILMLSIETDRNEDSIVRAVRRFQLTRREAEVLALILDGFSARETADMLAISEHTVQGYFKRLLSKTNSRNRVSMVASILDWKSSDRNDRQAVGMRAQR